MVSFPEIMLRGIEFNISELPMEYRQTLASYRHVPINYVLIGYNQFNNEIVHAHLYAKPTYESPEKMLYLTHEHWMQYQLIKHLPPEAVYEYFFNQ